MKKFAVDFNIWRKYVKKSIKKFATCPNFQIEKSTKKFAVDFDLWRKYVNLEGKGTLGVPPAGDVCWSALGYVVQFVLR